MNTDRQVFAIQLAQGMIVGDDFVKVTVDTSDAVVFLTHAIQRKVDNNLGIGTADADLFDFFRDLFVEQAVGWDINDARLAVFIYRLGNRNNILHEGLTTTDGKPVRGSTQALKSAVPFFQ